MRAHALSPRQKVCSSEKQRVVGGTGLLRCAALHSIAPLLYVFFSFAVCGNQGRGAMEWSAAQRNKPVPPTTRCFSIEQTFCRGESVHKGSHSLMNLSSSSMLYFI